MAGSAATGNTRVVHHTTGEVGEFTCRMAEFTHCRGWQMVEWLGYWYHSSEHLAVVTVDTSTGNTRVVHHTTCEVGELRGRVTGLTS